MIDSQEITFEDLQRTAIKMWDDNLGAMVYRLGDFDTTVPLLRRESDDGIVYYSTLVLCSYPPTAAIN
jgi:hypothetical protein